MRLCDNLMLILNSCCGVSQIELFSSEDPHKLAGLITALFSTSISGSEVNVMVGGRGRKREREREHGTARHEKQNEDETRTLGQIYYGCKNLPR